MAYLMVEKEGTSPFRIALDKAETQLGRSENNDVVLDTEEISRYHAKIRIQGSHAFLIDLDSLNGTYVNGQKIAERMLHDGDEIRLGSKCRIIFREDASPDISSFEGVVSPDTTTEEGEALQASIAQIREDMSRVDGQLTMINSSEEVPSPASDEFETIQRAYRRLSLLYQASMEVSHLIASNADLPSRLASVLDTALRVTGADRGFVLLREKNTDKFRVHIARKMGTELKEGSPSMGIAGKVIKTGEPVLMRNRNQDSHFGGRESIVAQQIQSAMGVPMTVNNRILGAIYVDTQNIFKSFTEEDLELFATMAAQMALAVENANLTERMLASERIRTNLGRFLSPAIVEQVMHQKQELELGGHKQVVSTLFCDIRGFTPMAEQLPPDELIALLNQHFTVMVNIVFENQGTLDKFIGDEIMAVYGSPIQGKDDALRAVKTAVMMQRANTELNEERRRAGKPAFNVGIGIATGEVVAGYVGSPKRMEFTVVGDRVNTARRLCGMAEPGQVIICGKTYTQTEKFIEARRLGTVSLKGKTCPERAYEVVGITAPSF